MTWWLIVAIISHQLEIYHGGFFTPQTTLNIQLINLFVMIAIAAIVWKAQKRKSLKEFFTNERQPNTKISIMLVVWLVVFYVVSWPLGVFFGQIFTPQIVFYSQIINCAAVFVLCVVYEIVKRNREKSREETECVPD